MQGHLYDVLVEVVVAMLVPTVSYRHVIKHIVLFPYIDLLSVITYVSA